MANSKISDLTAKTTLVDADIFVIVDSAASPNATKKILHSSIKANTETLANKTLTTPIIASIYQDAGKTKLMTVPNTASDTLCAIAATQTLAAKTLTTPVIASFYQDAGKTKLMTIPNTASDTLAAIAATQTLTNKTLTSPTINGTIATTGLTLPAVTLGGDITTDRWLATAENTFLGRGCIGAGNLAHVAGDTGYYNTAFGYNVLNATTTGYSNVAIGSKALQLNTTGYYNTVIGADALPSNTTSWGHTAIGFRALYAFTGTAAGGNRVNTVIGSQAMNALVTGLDNVAIGQAAALSMVAATNDVIIGSDACFSVANNNSSNVVIGAAALFNATSIGNNNVILGTYAASWNAGGSGNVIVGHEAGYGSDGSLFTGNVLLGYRAGYVLTSGQGNICLGYSAGDIITSGAFNIIIGFNIDPPLATTSNYLNIGGLILGDTSAMQLSFFGGTPVVQQTGYAVPIDLATCISALTALRTALNNLGLQTVV